MSSEPQDPDGPHYTPSDPPPGHAYSIVEEGFVPLPGHNDGDGSDTGGEGDYNPDPYNH